MHYVARVQNIAGLNPVVLKCIRWVLEG